MSEDEVQQGVRRGSRAERSWCGESLLEGTGGWGASDQDAKAAQVAEEALQIFSHQMRNGIDVNICLWLFPHVRRKEEV